MTSITHLRDKPKPVKRVEPKSAWDIPSKSLMLIEQEAGKSGAKKVRTYTHTKYTLHISKPSTSREELLTNLRKGDSATKVDKRARNTFGKTKGRNQKQTLELT